MKIALIENSYVGVGGLKTVSDNLSKILNAHVYLLSSGSVDTKAKVNVKDYKQIGFSNYDACMIMFQPKERKVNEHNKLTSFIRESSDCKILQRMHRFQPIPKGLDIDIVVCNSKAEQTLIPYYHSVVIRNPCTPLPLIETERQGVIWFMRFGSGQTENIPYTSDKCAEEVTKYINKTKVPINVYGGHVGIFGFKLKKTFIGNLTNPSIKFHGICNSNGFKRNLICSSKAYLNTTVHGWNEDIGTSLVEAMQYKTVPVASVHYLKAKYINENQALFFDKLFEIPKLLNDAVENYDNYKSMIDSNRKFIIKNQGVKITKQKYENLVKSL